MNGAVLVSSAYEDTIDRTTELSVGLQSAIRDRDREAVKNFLRRGADVNWRNCYGEAALFVCTNFDDRDGVQITADLIVAVPACDLILPDNYGMRPLNNALLRRRMRTAQIIQSALDR